MASWLNIREDRKLDLLKIPPEFRVNGKAPIYIAKARIDSSLVPGYVRQRNPVASTGAVRAIPSPAANLLTSPDRDTSPNSSTKMSTIRWLNVREGRTLNTDIIDPEYFVNGEPPIVIARAWHGGHLLPGYVRLSNHVGYFVQRREVVKKTEFQLLLDGSLEWQEVGEGDPVPDNALKVGKTCREPLFLGKAFVNGEDLLGMVTGSVCSVATDRGVFETRTFSILVQVRR
ncbi:Hypothetical predicted protein [Cloeon dipterum]|uniref:Uncharacterized protein n=1 Tax=Cloeon dipterum TaxID=197152 RepID=A0A8S1DST1_9INSE|nr:Hypothetical predicted protein [Cloeon dipterum]